MAASLHIARYSPADALRMLRTMRRERRRLARRDGLAACRLFYTVEFEPRTGGIPTPTRWALFCAWRDPEARDEFVADDGALEPFAGPAKESWSVSLETVRVMMGQWRGWCPPTDDVEALRSDEPVAVITYGRLRPRYVPAFFWNNRKAVRDALRQPGLVAMLGMGDHPQVASTFSLWRSKGDVVRFAYGGGAAHRPIQRRSLDEDWARDDFFARFRPLTARGSWDGREPLAMARAGDAVAGGA